MKIKGFSDNDVKTIIDIGRKLLDGFLFTDIYLDVLFNQQNTMIFYKDSNSNYLGSNEFVSERAGFKQPFLLVGKSDYEMAWSKEQSDTFRKDDKEVILQRAPKIGIEEYQYKADGTLAVDLTDKFPVYSSKRDKIGILGISIDITEYKLAQQKILELTQNIQLGMEISQDLIGMELINSIKILQQKAKSKDCQLIVKGKLLSFTQRQMECLSLLIQGKTHKQIAKNLQISYRTVEEYVNQIKFKMGCRTKSEVIENILQIKNWDDK